MIEARYNLKDKKANTTLIFLVLEHDKKRVRITTNLSLPPKFWNGKTQKVRENREFPNGEKINDRLKEITQAVEDAVKFILSQGIEPNVFLIKEKYKEFLENPKKQRSTSIFWDCFEEFINERKGEISSRTIIDYDCSLRKHLKAIEQKNTIPLNFQSLRKEGGFIKALEKYFSDEAINAKGTIGLLTNTKGKQLKNLKSFLNWCFAENKTTIFDTSHIVTYQEEVDNIYLNDKEIEQLLNLNIEDIEKQRIRDLFVFGCETALRFSDLRRIKPEHISGNYLMMVQTKTEGIVHPPLNSRCRLILEKYNNALPNFNERDISYFNKGIREICMEAEINQNVVMMKSDGKVKKEVYYKKYELVTSHTCRRSFCTNRYLSKKIPLNVIMAISGHKTEKSFMRYLKLSKKEIIEAYEAQLIE